MAAVRRYKRKVRLLMAQRRRLLRELRGLRIIHGKSLLPMPHPQPAK